MSKLKVLHKVPSFTVRVPAYRIKVPRQAKVPGGQAGTSVLVYLRYLMYLTKYTTTQAETLPFPVLSPLGLRLNHLVVCVRVRLSLVRVRYEQLRLHYKGDLTTLVTPLLLAWLGLATQSLPTLSTFSLLDSHGTVSPFNHASFVAV